MEANVKHTILEILGIQQSDLFISNTIIVTDKGKPFGAVQVKDGKSVLRVGNDIPRNGYHIDIES